MTMDNLVAMFEQAKEYEDKFVAVSVTMKGAAEPELIINPVENFDYKLDYYKKAYNHDLTLRACNDIRIVGMARGKEMADFWGFE